MFIQLNALLQVHDYNLDGQPGWGDCSQVLTWHLECHQDTPWPPDTLNTGRQWIMQPPNQQVINYWFKSEDKADEKGRYDCSENSWYRSVASSCILRQVKSTLSEKSFSLSFRAVNSKLSIIVPPLFLLSIYEIISEFHSWEVFRHGHHSHTFFRMHFVGFMECRPNLTSRLSLSTALCLSVKPVNSVLSFAFLDLRPSRQWFVEK